MRFIDILEEYEREKYEYRTSQYGDVWSFLSWRNVKKSKDKNFKNQYQLIDLCGPYAELIF